MLNLNERSFNAGPVARHARGGSPQRIIRIGGNGAGYSAKLLVNLLWFGQAVATGEALLLARRAGIDLDVLRQTLATSAASTAFVRDDLGALLDGD